MSDQYAAQTAATGSFSADTALGPRGGPDPGPGAGQGDSAGQETEIRFFDGLMGPAAQSAALDGQDVRSGLGQDAAEPRAAPGPDASDAEWAAFHQSIGAPERPDGYTVSDKIQEGDVDSLRSMAHQAGLSQRQLDKLIESNAAILEARRAEGETRLKANFEALKAEAGAQFPALIRHAERGLRAFGPETREMFAIMGLHNDPGVVKGLAKLGAAMAEDWAPRSAASGARNPYDKSNPNLTEQARLEKDDPNAARAMAAAAGASVTL